MHSCRLVLLFSFFFILFGRSALVGAPLYTYTVADCATGRIIASKAADIRTYPASLTKMMTAILVFDAIRDGQLTLDQKVRVSNYAAAQMPGKLWLKAGSSITVRDALHGMLIKSFNDCAVVLAEAVAGTEHKFARRMNQRAAVIGMRRTVFKNASGVPNKSQVTTSYDMMLLAREFRVRYPEFYHIVGNTTWRYRGRIYHTTNRLLSNVRGVDGMKTGYIALSGFNLAISAERQGRRIVAVVMGGKTSLMRDKKMRELIEATFRQGGLKTFKDVHNRWAYPSKSLHRFAQESDHRIKAHAQEKGQLKMPEKPTELAENKTEEAIEHPIPDKKPDLFTQIENGIYDAEMTLAQQDIDLEKPIALHRKPQEKGEEDPKTSLPSSSTEIRNDPKNEAPSEAVENSPSPHKIPEKKEWGIQLGTYKNPKSATTRAAEVQKNINSLQTGKIVVETVNQEKKKLFSSQITHLSESQALSACEELKDEGKGCVAIPWQGAAS